MQFEDHIVGFNAHLILDIVARNCLVNFNLLKFGIHYVKYLNILIWLIEMRLKFWDMPNYVFKYSITMDT